MAGPDLMRIACFFQGFAMGRGRATTCLELITPLAGRGHDVDVFVPSARFVKELDGVTVRPASQLDRSRSYDVVVYNSGLSSDTLRVIRTMGGRRLMLQHSYNSNDAGLRLADQVWYPSFAAMRADRHSGYTKFVVPPPINPALYRTKPGDRISLCLSSHWKGGPVVAAVARALPHRDFLVVKDPRGNGLKLFRGLKNVELVDFMPPRDFYAATRLHLFPSRSESYGRVGVESSVSGIPLIASTCPGIREAMAGHGIFVPRTNTRKWVAMVEHIMSDSKVWKRASRDVAERGRKITYRADQGRFCDVVESMNEERQSFAD